MQNALLYQAYSGSDFINECRYSLLKYLHVYNLKPPPATTVFIYTDQPHLFADFLPFFHQLICVPVSAETIAAWRGPQNFVHRFKIEMMADVFNRFDGSLLYCDTDTYATTFLEDVFSGIENGGFYMHEYEGMIDKTKFPVFRKWEAFLSSTPLSYNHKQLQFSKALSMYNAGVVGLNANHKELLNDVLALTDSVYQKFPKHIAEQFAFSYCLQQSGKITEAKNVLAHYWDLKEFRQLLARFFHRNGEESIPALVKKVAGLNALAIMQQKKEYHNLSLLRRLAKKISGNAWRIDAYERRL